MNVYIVECGHFSYTAIAKDEAAAIKAVQEKNSLQFMNFTAKQIDLEGYVLISPEKLAKLKKNAEKIEDKQPENPQPENKEPEKLETQQLAVE